MIDHTNCDHPSTSGARAKCRRARAAGGVHTEDGQATPKDVDFSKSGGGGKKAQTPRDRDKQCDVCGVERIAYRGLDVISGVVLYVGERCYYMVKRDPAGAIPLD